MAKSPNVSLLTSHNGNKYKIMLRSEVFCDQNCCTTVVISSTCLFIVVTHFMVLVTVEHYRVLHHSNKLNHNWTHITLYNELHDKLKFQVMCT